SRFVASVALGLGTGCRNGIMNEGLRAVRLPGDRRISVHVNREQELTLLVLAEKVNIASCGRRMSNIGVFCRDRIRARWERTVHGKVLIFRVVRDDVLDMDIGGIRIAAVVSNGNQIGIGRGVAGYEGGAELLIV